jgi:hypothetical protein
VAAPEATAALGRLVAADDASLPRVERARGALYLSALQARLGDRTGATATLQRAPPDRELRAWIEKTAGQLEIARGRYRVPEGTPAALVSASDDDPYVPPPPPAPRVEPAPQRPKLHGFKVHPVSKPTARPKGAASHGAAASKKPSPGKRPTKPVPPSTGGGPK